MVGRILKWLPVIILPHSLETMKMIPQPAHEHVILYNKKHFVDVIQLASRRGAQPLAKSQQGKGTSVLQHKEQNSANILNELGSSFFLSLREER